LGELSPNSGQHLGVRLDGFADGQPKQWSRRFDPDSLG
jgi:hypothetical protein